MARLRRVYDPLLLTQMDAITIGSKGKSSVRPTTFMRIPGFSGGLGEWYVGGLVETFQTTTYHRMGIRKGYKPKDAAADKRDYFPFDIPLSVFPKLIEHMLAMSFYDERIRDLVLGQLFQDTDFLELINLLAEKSEITSNRMLAEAAAETERDQRMSGNEDEDEPWNTFAGRC
jgi:hypothetical protein